ncbi:transposase [Amycolatopsis mediterranei S699]|uniref:Transposase n=2 Tax=Amycolatopsis mediterranei TaxID=33910 RepID=A0A0H3DCS9_AMYMU|nr:IS110 family transposase [Amycolatopsis mediterranei]ADJ47848.1 transposase [Amycolatopsis mediterranei U32]AEK44739.1 transposase [Amycolatopsis mediterranei S699]AFO79559.1 transposase [Amycolatopsis mediterranei S699]AGT86687.1 transposase [Amycolatopsis mediterranei RB]KDO10347.1 transposase [Amycolatopsis mediterranei]
MSLSELSVSFFVGIDWGATEHAVCVVDENGRGKTAFTLTHTAAGFTDLIRRLSKLGDPIEIPIGIERPDGRLVDALLEAGFPVVPVKPNAIKAWREAEVLSGAKSDTADAAIIAEYLRLRQHKLRPATPYSPQTTALRTVVRTRDDLVTARVAAANQLAALLDTHWPGAKAVFADVESPIALEFLTRYPTAASATSIGPVRMAAFCVKHGYSGRRSAAELLTRLHTAPAGTTDPTLTEAIRDAVLAMVSVLRTLGTALKDLGRSVTAHLSEHPDNAIFTSLPRSGQINAAQMLAAWGDARQAYDHADAVAALAGLCPVTKASGKHHAVSFRWACNTRFRQAMVTFADNSRHASPWAADLYRRARSRGCDHPHAVRILARAWVRVIYRCWLDRKPYDPALHGAAQQTTEHTAAA